MRLVLYIILIFLKIVDGSPAIAQNNPGQQLFDIFSNQLNREVNRQQQRAYEQQALIATVRSELPHGNTAWQRFLQTEALGGHYELAH